jgi:ankyrin repeat protein
MSQIQQNSNYLTEQQQQQQQQHPSQLYQLLVRSSTCSSTTLAVEPHDQPPQGLNDDGRNMDENGVNTENDKNETTYTETEIRSLMDELQSYTIIERGEELRDCARYNDFTLLHTILYATFYSSASHSTHDDVVATTINNNNCNHGAVLQLIHTVDALTGNTALHMAAANNHARIVQFLLQVEQATINDMHDAASPNDTTTGDPSSSSDAGEMTISTNDTNLPPSEQQQQQLRLVQRTNTSGNNTPLHYAITNRALESVRALLHDYSTVTNNDATTVTVTATVTATATAFTNNSTYIDVLQKNAAGRSCLTEAFTLTSNNKSQNTDDENDNIDDESKRNHDILTYILEHPSANEERLLTHQSGTSMSGKKEDGTTSLNYDSNMDHNTNVTTEARDNLPPCHTHHLRLVGSGDNVEHDEKGIEIHIREMAMAVPSNGNDETVESTTSTTTTNNDLIQILGGTNPVNDTTGYGIWSASIIMGQWMTDIFYHSQNRKGEVTPPPPIESSQMRILELGAGCGIPGITVAKLYQRLYPSESMNVPKIYLTDLNPITLTNLQYNISLNELDSIATAVSFDWNELIQNDEPNSAKLWPWMASCTEPTDVESRIDILIGSDLVYQKEAVPILLQTIVKLRPSRLYYGAGKNRDGHSLFIQSLCQRMKLIQSFPAPKLYRTTNPLYSQDDDECFIHFQDLLQLNVVNANDDGDDSKNYDTFTLYEFASNE